jgi:ATP-binding cassette subfamily B protein
LAWWWIGHATLQGRLDGNVLLTWGLLLFTLIPFRLLGTWLQGGVAVSLGGLLKQRLLRGALNLELDDADQQGVGELFGRVLEADRVEALALSGGFVGLVALIELGFAAVVMSLGAGGGLQVGLLLGWLGVTGCLSWHYVRQRRHWSENRLDLTQDLVEGMVGHRTRLVQEPRATWHVGEDHALEGYVHRSRLMDRMMTWVLGGVPRGWLCLGTVGLVPVFVAGTTSTSALAVSLGGMLLAYRALEKVSLSLVHLADTGIAWKQIAPLFHAAARTEPLGTLAGLAQPQTTVQGGALLEGHDLVFRYGERSEAVLRGCDIRINVGDHAFLQGVSGGGKSTLVAVLSGLRQAQSGLLLLRGLDRATLGAQAWRQRAVAAPQFHDNHVVSGPFAFNLLMGRRWPPQAEDLQDAETLCRDLGLGELIDRMPGGLLQMVGETGWQLSHGEQSRLFIARALLQQADIVILDESFAALDPANLQRALRCVYERVRTLLVIAHL